VPKLEQISEEKVSQYPDRLLMIVHADLHKWYRSDRSVIHPVLITLHKTIFREMTLRGLHHVYVNMLDDKAVPIFPPDEFLQILNNFRVKGNADLSKAEQLKRWHAAIHNIWMGVRVIRELIKPNEEIQNAHDIIADQLKHHPEWDELDKDWADAIKSFNPYPQHAQKDDVLEEETKSPIYISKVVSGFPDEITLIHDAILKTENKVYIQPGIAGVLYNSIYAHILRVTQFGEVTPVKPARVRSMYDLKLIRPHAEENLLPISIDDHGFHSMYPISAAFVCLVGSIVNNRLSLNDADVLIKSGTPDWIFQHIASSIIVNHPMGSFLHILRDQGLGPTAGFEIIYNLILEEHF
jgi:hypothetical protein